MKNIFYLMIFTLIFTSCEKEELNVSNQSQETTENLAKSGSGDTAVLSFQEHKAILERNSFIIGELIRLSPSDKTYINNSLDPVSNSVSMNTLFYGANSSLFLRNYKFIAEYAIADYYGCRDSDELVLTPDSDPWPPRDPDPIDPIDPIDPNSTFSSYDNISQSVLDLIDQLVFSQTEIVMNSPNYMDNILTVGHPLTSSLTHTGFLIFTQPDFNYLLLKNGATRRCALYSQVANIGDSDLYSNNLIILSRPQFSQTRAYSYLNFDMHRYLRDLGNNNSEDPFIGGI